MKKLLMTAAIAATFMTAGQMNAQVNSAEKAAQEQTDQNEFREIQVDKLPGAVTEAVKATFEKATIEKAYVNDQKQYKLVLEIDGVKKTVFANAQGKWIDPEK